MKLFAKPTRKSLENFINETSQSAVAGRMLGRREDPASTGILSAAFGTTDQRPKTHTTKTNPIASTTAAAYWLLLLAPVVGLPHSPPTCPTFRLVRALEYVQAPSLSHQLQQ